MTSSLARIILKERSYVWDEKGQRGERQRSGPPPNPTSHSTLPAVANSELSHLVWTEKNLALEGNLRKTANLSRINYSRKDSN